MQKDKRLKSLFFVFILLSFTADIGFAAWQAKVVDMFDGDTLILSVGGRAMIIKLFGIDCPEKEQPFGIKAKDYSVSVVSGKQINIITVDEKRYPMCKVYVEGRCLNEELLKAGYAWHDDRDFSYEKWEIIEKKAVEQKKGLWSQEKPEPPWEFRGKQEVRRTERRCFTIKLGGKHKTGTVPVYRPKKRGRNRKR